jgi:hypothetical protein
MEINYTVYKVTNKITGKFYVGTHKTKDLDDGYMGSGKYLRRSINKHGVINFDKEILFNFETSEEMFNKEQEIVNENFVSDRNTYNLKTGGIGGFDYVNNTKRNYQHNNREGSLDNLKIGVAINAANFKKRQEDYYLNPKTCKHCDDVISYTKYKRKNIFCTRSCASIFNYKQRM